MNTDRSQISAPALLQRQHYQPIQIARSQAGITQRWRYLRTRWGGERLRECLGSDKVERGYWQRYAGLAEGDIKRRGLGGRLTQFLSLTQWTGMSGRMTNPKTSQRTQHTHTHTIHPHPEDRCPFHYIIIIIPHRQSTARHLQSFHLSLSRLCPAVSSGFTFSVCHLTLNFSACTKPCCSHCQAWFNHFNKTKCERLYCTTQPVNLSRFTDMIK